MSSSTRWPIIFAFHTPVVLALDGKTTDVGWLNAARWRPDTLRLMDPSRSASSRSTAINASLYGVVGIGDIAVGLTTDRAFLWMGPIWLFGAAVQAVRAWRSRRDADQGDARQRIADK